MEEKTTALEAVELAAFQLISLSGDAIDCYFEALRHHKTGNIPEREACMAKGEEQMHKAHKIQTDFISEEASGNCPPYSLVMVHAQDYMMNTIIIKKLVEEMMEMYDYVNQRTDS